MNCPVLLDLLRILAEHLVIEIIVSVVSAIIISSVLFLLKPAFAITLDVVIDADMPYLSLDDSLAIEPPNNTFLIKLNYSVRSIRLTRKVAKWVGLAKLNISLLLGATKEDHIVFYTNNGSSNTISIDVINAAPFTKKLTCQYRLENNIERTEIVPVIEAVYSNEQSGLRKLLAKLLLRYTISWRGYKKLILLKKSDKKVPSASS